MDNFKWAGAKEPALNFAVKANWEPTDGNPEISQTLMIGHIQVGLAHLINPGTGQVFAADLCLDEVMIQEKEQLWKTMAEAKAVVEWYVLRAFLADQPLPAGSLSSENHDLSN